MSNFAFTHFSYIGDDAEKFLQGQVTVNVGKLSADEFCPTAICDLKGRVHFGLWLKRINSQHFDLIVSQDMADELQVHIKKYGAFSKAKLSAATAVYPAVIAQQATFSSDIAQQADALLWQKTAIQHGQAWISQTTAHLFQPQELRLHQRGGVDYDKGCYLGQEIVARLWFKAKPKHWLHLVQGQGDTPAAATQLHNDVQVVNAVQDGDHWLALVVAKPDCLAALNVHILDLPNPLNDDVARPKD